MQRLDTRGFNKEKLIFLVTAAGLAGAVYVLLTSAPVALEIDRPVSNEPGPTRLLTTFSDAREAEDYYVVDGMPALKTQPAIPINRKRKTPFAPAEDYRAAKIKAVVQQTPKPGPIAAPPPPPPPAPPPEPEKKDEAKDWDGKDAEAQVAFMGVVLMNGQTYGLLKHTDDSGPPRRVKVGDTIPEYNYKVSKIEKQAIWVTDGEDRPFILKNKVFGGDGTFEADDDDGDTKKPAKKGEKGDKKTGAKKDTKAAEKPAKPAAPAANPLPATVPVNDANVTRPNRPNRTPGGNGNTEGARRGRFNPRGRMDN